VPGGTDHEVFPGVVNWSDTGWALAGTAGPSAVPAAPTSAAAPRAAAHRDTPPFTGSDRTRAPRVALERHHTGSS
jgi:hypothetical protein